MARANVNAQTAGMGAGPYSFNPVDRVTDTNWDAYSAAVVACAPLVPLFALVGIVVAYVAPIRVPRATPFVGYPVLDGTIVAVVIWLLLTWLYFAIDFSSVRRANTRIYGQLWERFAGLAKLLEPWAPPQVTIVPRPPVPDAAGSAYVYSFDIVNDSASPLQGMKLSLTFSNALPQLSGQAPAGWTVEAPGAATDTVTLNAAGLAPGTTYSVAISVVGTAPVAVELSISGTAAPVPGSPAPTATLGAITTISPVQANNRTPFVARGESQSANVQEALAHRDYVAAQLQPSSKGLRWVLATGYVDLWSRIHRAEEAMIEVETPATVIQGALNDELRLVGSTIDSKDDLIAELLTAAQAVSPQAMPLFKSPLHQATAAPTNVPVDVARAALRHVSNSINAVRESSWEGLVRVRNHLNVSILLAGLFTYVLLAIVISQPQRVAPAVITRNVGMAANGSTRKKMELMATMENSAIEVRKERAASCGMNMDTSRVPHQPTRPRPARKTALGTADSRKPRAEISLEVTALTESLP